MRYTRSAGSFPLQDNRSLVLRDVGEHYHSLQEAVAYCTPKELDIRNKNLTSVYFTIHSYINKNVQVGVTIEIIPPPSLPHFMIHYLYTDGFRGCFPAY